MHSTHSKEFTSPEFISRFQLLGEIIVTATERLKATRSLRESETRYRIVADFTYDWEYWANIDGTLNYVSPSCERISGYKASETVVH